MGGDLSGFDERHYEDIETFVADYVGRIDVHKVHHHCSEYSTNDTWLNTTRPRIGIIIVWRRKRLRASYRRVPPGPPQPRGQDVLDRGG